MYNIPVLTAGNNSRALRRLRPETYNIPVLTVGNNSRLTLIMIESLKF